MMQQPIPPAYRKKSISFMPQITSEGQQTEALTPSQRQRLNAGLSNGSAEQERDRIFNRFSSRSKNFKQTMGGQGHLGSLVGAGGATGT